MVYLDSTSYTYGYYVCDPLHMVKINPYTHTQCEVERQSQAQGRNAFVCLWSHLISSSSSDSSLYANFLLLNESRHLVMLGTRSVCHKWNHSNSNNNNNYNKPNRLKTSVLHTYSILYIRNIYSLLNILYIVYFLIGICVRVCMCRHLISFWVTLSKWPANCLKMIIKSV